ncbi:MAG: hypothetical protein RR774_02175 [Acinetobacter sp.]
MMRKLILASIFICLPIITQAGIPPEIIKDAENKGNLKTLLSKKCSLDKWKAVDEHYIPPNGCNLTFSQLYAHDESFRKKVSDAFKQSPFDGRNFEVEDSSQLYPPNGDADKGWLIITQTGARSGTRATVFSVPEYNQTVTFISNRIFLDDKDCKYGFYGDNKQTLALEYAVNHINGIDNNLKNCKQLTKINLNDIYEGKHPK